MHATARTSQNMFVKSCIIQKLVGFGFNDELRALIPVDPHGPYHSRLDVFVNFGNYCSVIQNRAPAWYNEIKYILMDSTSTEYLNCTLLDYPKLFELSHLKVIQ